MDKSEKDFRKQIQNDLRKKAAEEFEASLPMSRAKFEELFDYLDEELQEQSCDDTPALTKTFLENENIANIDEVVKWLADEGGYCDCEILANVEEQFE
ncbi:DUF2695 domain-containing protein [Dyadobacter sandarakinus]|uniref:DUF2695 domain-containing protein n=1 Tax=Dyadobacter sandarakinus TaxID=2747268 RepID=A0ABX7I8P3_9BACT|nr:DUF2695 domain-containing protein [Dyadobacter sandarakinus]QRR02198.1 DUF2695 domain-containing protein [Dyadobacter sandarakinus]